ncbi:MAG: hypothetical protein VX519_12285 [Myxococcota bacterium]|nr:hypothetical protein [Myxococcota bacterium]
MRVRANMVLCGVWVVLTAGCSEYNVKGFGEPLEESSDVAGVPEEGPVVDTAVEEGEEEPGDTAVDTAVEEGPLEEEFCTPFDDFDAWSYIGGGNWSVSGGRLYENRGGLYGSVAYAHDVGAASHWRVEVSTAFAGSLNDMAGIVFHIEPSTLSYFIARWDDPQGDYGRHQPGGSMDVLRCVQGVCSPLASSSGVVLLHPADETMVDWSVEVNAGEVTIIWAGQVVFQQVVQGLPARPGLVGLYSNDNDGGIIYDDFCVYAN